MHMIPMMVTMVVVAIDSETYVATNTITTVVVTSSYGSYVTTAAVDYGDYTCGSV